MAVVTPWFGTPELEEDYLEAIRLGPEPDELIVVDNCSPEPVEFAALRLDGNYGFAGGSNAGLKIATADKVVFLNSDIKAIREGWLSGFCEHIEDGVLVGARIRTDQHADVDGMSMPYLDGWCLGGMREDFLELGGWDDSLEEPSYYSDNLLCLEARALGFVLREAPVGLTHKGGGTSKANGYLLPSTIANRVVYEQRVRELVEV